MRIMLRKNVRNMHKITVLLVMLIFNTFQRFRRMAAFFKVILFWMVAKHPGNNGTAGLDVLYYRALGVAVNWKVLVKLDARFLCALSVPLRAYCTLRPRSPQTNLLQHWSKQCRI